MESITLGAGCFWCVEAIFAEVEGVSEAVSGYSGGKSKNPTYKEVCSGTSGHVEVCQVTYNPEVISLEQILEIYFRTHDPTTLNRQGADVGTQYRSVIFYHTEAQREVAATIKRRLDEAGVWKDPIVTAIEPFDRFYPAEDYHQDYYANNARQPYCRMVIAPKVEKFRKVFAEFHKNKKR